MMINCTVIQVLRESFVFWQRGTTSAAGKAYIRMYKIDTDDTMKSNTTIAGPVAGGKVPAVTSTSSYPHIAIIDPRTGAKVHQMTGYQEPDQLLQALLSFLEGHDLHSMKAPTDKSIAAAEARARSRGNSLVDEPADKTPTTSTTTTTVNKEVEVAKAVVLKIYGPIPIEPANGPDVCRVQLKYQPDCCAEAIADRYQIILTTVVRRFFKNTTIRELYAWARSELLRCTKNIKDTKEGDLPVPCLDFSLSTAFPAKLLESEGTDGDKTIAEEGLAGAQVLLRLL